MITTISMVHNDYEITELDKLDYYITADEWIIARNMQNVLKKGTKIRAMVQDNNELIEITEFIIDEITDFING